MPPPGDASRLTCSARACRQDARWALRWNNPRLHAPDRRKTWLACPAHRDSLRDFLSLRGFLRETVDVADLGDSGVGEPVADDAAAADPVAGDGGPGAPA